MSRRVAGFTLIEMMAAVLMLALLASAVALSFSQPLRAARSQDVFDQIRAFDATSRKAAVASGHTVRIAIDLSAGTLSRLDGPQLADLRTRESLPVGYSIDEVRIAGESTSVGNAPIDISSSGFSRSYSVHIRGPQFDQWIVVAGLTGQSFLAQDDNAIPTSTEIPRHDAD
jgi:prepilin-type N-terminal cleavage/methylation domain-containing protein